MYARKKYLSPKRKKLRFIPQIMQPLCTARYNYKELTRNNFTMIVSLDKLLIVINNYKMINI